MLLFQEAILARFGFLPCVIQKKQFMKDVSKYIHVVISFSLLNFYINFSKLFIIGLVNNCSLIFPSQFLTFLLVYSVLIYGTVTVM